MKTKIILTSTFVSAVLLAGAALADNPGGTPNLAAGARGHNAPSSAEPTPGVIAGHPHAPVSFKHGYHAERDAPAKAFVD